MSHSRSPDSPSRIHSRTSSRSATFARTILSSSGGSSPRSSTSCSGVTSRLAMAVSSCTEESIRGVSSRQLRYRSPLAVPSSIQILLIAARSRRVANGRLVLDAGTAVNAGQGTQHQGLDLRHLRQCPQWPPDSPVRGSRDQRDLAARPAPAHVGPAGERAVTQDCQERPDHPPQGH